MRKDRNGAYSTDEDDDEEGGVFGKNENVGSDGHIFGDKGDGDITMRENPDIDDSDNDDQEFEDAAEEEQQDKILESIRKSKNISGMGMKSSLDGTVMKR